MSRWHTCFETDALVLKSYPLPRGRRSPRVPHEALQEVCVDWIPPTVRTREGEYLFIEATQARELADFADRHGVPFVRRTDVWSLILEEFLDTEFSPQVQEGTLRLLEENGVSRAEVQAIRERVGKRMLVLTAITWEWTHYGLYDVLIAMRPRLFGSRRAFEQFTQEAMRLADRGHVQPATREDFLRAYTEGR